MFLLLLLISKSVISIFRVGRISEGKFEYSELNGWMTPGEGKELCDRDDRCGGFTYKVGVRAGKSCKRLQTEI